ncbi:efflux RND transporter periplasmic adaptor subunit [Gemmatimonadota bacterium]
MKQLNVILVIAVVLLLATAGVILRIPPFAGGDRPEAGQTETIYVCPMHPSVVSDHPGDCPICGMSLVPQETEVHDHENDSQTVSDQGEAVYTCPMHPSVVSDRPGDCPICGMSLVPSATEANMGGDVTMAGDLPDVTLSPLRRSLANVATSTAHYADLEKKVTAVGRFAVNEQRMAQVAAWIGGRVEKLYVDFTGTTVTEGEPLLDIYSPAFVQTGEEYLATLPPTDGIESPVMASARERLRQATRQRLTLWGVTSEQIEQIEESRTVPTTITIHAPASGTVLKKMVHEGMYIKEGQTLFDIADLTSIWMYADFYEEDFSSLHIGGAVEVRTDAWPERTFRGTISFIEPLVDPRSRTVRVRAELQNRQGQLKPMMFGTATIRIPLEHILTIPASAIINTGERQVVWEEVEENRFSPRHVILGHRIGEWYQVLDGLEAGAEVASSGGFLLDSESQLRAMTGAAAAAAAGHSHDTGQQVPPEARPAP